MEREELMETLDAIEREVKDIRNRLETFDDILLKEEIEMIANRIKFRLSEI